MEQFIEQVVTGIMTGSLYSVIALTLVLIFRCTNMLNFAQGEMATFTTYLAWSLMVLLPYWGGFVVTIAVAFVIGVALERGLIRWVEDQPQAAFLVGLGLFMVFNSLSGAVYGPQPYSFPQPWAGPPIELGGVTIPRHNLLVFLVSVSVMALIYLLMQHTKLGLALRATAIDRTAAELMGVPTRHMLALGWGLAAAQGAVAGMLVAPIVVLYPGMMFFLLMFSFTAAVLGGLDSVPGAMVGGIAVGLIQSLTGAYLDEVVDLLRLPFSIADANQYRDIVTMVALILVLLVRPRGLFGRSTIERV